VKKQDHARQEQPDDEIDLREYWRVINRRKWSILAFAGSVSLITTLVVYSLSPIYQATATVLIESPQKNATSLEEVYGLERVGNEFFKTQVEILKSRELVDRVVGELGLLENPEFSMKNNNGYREKLASILPFLHQPEKELTVEERKNEIVRSISSSLNVSDIRGTQLAKVSFESHDPVMAAKVANKFVDAYIEYNFDIRLAARDKSLAWLNERLGPLKNSLSESEKKLQQYREQQGLVDVEGVRSLVAKELNEITVDFVEARTKRAQLENVLQQIGNGDEWINNPTILNHPAMQKLIGQRADAEQQLSELGKRYGAKHPKMVAAQNQLLAVQKNMQQQLSGVVESIKKDYLIAKNNENSLQKNMDKVKEEVQDINRKEHQLNELVREVDANRKVYESFLTRFQQTGALGSYDQVNIRLAEAAAVPISPSKPNKKLIIALSFMASIMLAVMAAFFLEFINNGVRRIEDVENKLSQRLLGIVPQVAVDDESRLKPESIFSDENLRSMAESMRAVRTAMCRSGAEKSKIILVTSSLPGEGKTTVSCALSYAFAQIERVLLIDADMRKPSVSKLFSIPHKHRGLSNLIVGEPNVRDCFLVQPNANLTVVPSGVVPANPSELLSSDRFAMMLKKLAKHYDRIIIDSPPIHAVSDALIISRLVDEVVYVVKSDATPLPVVKEGIARLQQADVKMAGVVLNHFNVREADYYQYYYGSYDYTTAKS